MKESEIQKTIMEYLEVKEALGSLYGIRTGSGLIKTGKRYFKTGKRGCPDITLSYKVCGLGIFVGLEVKKEGGKQSESQIEAEKAILKSGGFYFIVKSITDVEKAFDLVHKAVVYTINN